MTSVDALDIAIVLMLREYEKVIRRSDHQTARSKQLSEAWDTLTSLRQFIAANYADELPMRVD